MKISQKKRKIGYTYGSISGFVPFRGGKSIFFESSIERDMILLLEYNSNVTKVIEQPMTINYENSNGRKTRYTPDFLVHFSNQKSWLIEIKPYDKLLKDWDNIRPKVKVGFQYAKENNYVFHIFHDLKVRGEEFEVVKRLSQYQRLNYDLSKTAIIKNILSTTKTVLVSDLLTQLVDNTVDKHEALRRILYLVSIKEIWCDLSNNLEITKTNVWLNSDLNG